MSRPQWIKARRVCIYLTENDKIGHQTAHLALLGMAERHGLAGMTVYRGLMGYGKRGTHVQHILRLAEGMPVVIEIIDTLEKTDTFLDKISAYLHIGFVTREEIEMLKRNPNNPTPNNNKKE